MVEQKSNKSLKMLHIILLVKPKFNIQIEFFMCQSWFLSMINNLNPFLSLKLDFRRGINFIVQW